MGINEPAVAQLDMLWLYIGPEDRKLVERLLKMDGVFVYQFTVRLNAPVQIVFQTPVSVWTVEVVPLITEFRKRYER